MKKYFKKIVILISLMVILVLPYVVSASPAYDNLKKTGSGSGGGANAPWADIADINGANSLAGIVGTVIQAFLGILGVLFLAYTIYAGYTWMTAQGDEEKVTKAKDTLQRAVIGLIITIGSYAISVWVFEKLLFNTAILK